MDKQQKVWVATVASLVVVVLLFLAVFFTRYNAQGARQNEVGRKTAAETLVGRRATILRVRDTMWSGQTSGTKVLLEFQDRPGFRLTGRVVIEVPHSLRRQWELCTEGDTVTLEQYVDQNRYQGSDPWEHVIPSIHK